MDILKIIINVIILLKMFYEHLYYKECLKKKMIQQFFLKIKIKIEI